MDYAKYDAVTNWRENTVNVHEQTNYLKSANYLILTLPYGGNSKFLDKDLMGLRKWEEKWKDSFIFWGVSLFYYRFPFSRQLRNIFNIGKSQLSIIMN